MLFKISYLKVFLKSFLALCEPGHVPDDRLLGLHPSLQGFFFVSFVFFVENLIKPLRTVLLIDHRPCRIGARLACELAFEVAIAAAA